MLSDCAAMFKILIGKTTARHFLFPVFINDIRCGKFRRLAPRQDLSKIRKNCALRDA